MKVNSVNYILETPANGKHHGFNRNKVIGLKFAKVIHWSTHYSVSANLMTVVEMNVV